MDAAKSKELGLAQYRSGVSLGFVVASQTGLGQLSAAKETGKYVLGVDSDQEAIFKDSDPAIAKQVVSSVLKNIDVSLLQAYERYKAGNLPFGKAEALGLKEGAVGIVQDGNMATMATPDIKDAIKKASDEISEGKITVPSTFGMSTEDLNAIRNKVRP